jgi:hypothetical protein
MAKKKTRNYSSGEKGNKWGNLAVKTASVMGGVIAASQIGKLVEKESAVNGVDLFGLRGETSKYATGAVITAAGVLASVFVKNKTVRNVALGVTVAGASKLLNVASNKSIVALGNVVDNAISSTPFLPPISGVNDFKTRLPGMGALPTPFDYSVKPALSRPVNSNLYGTKGRAGIF